VVIYIESTIPSYVVARPTNHLLQAARQRMARDWWYLQREKHELFTSQIVLDEIAAGELEMARRRLKLMADVSVLALKPAAEVLADKILKSGRVPPKADSDAAHIALATIHEMDILLTLNCRHIANGTIAVRLRRLVQAEGYELPAICTPEELLGE